MQTPEQAALAGFTAASGARAVACHVVNDYAAVYTVTSEPSGRGDTVSIVLRAGSLWREISSGSAGATWVGFLDDDDDEDDEERGVLVVPGDLSAPGPVLMELDDVQVHLDPSEPHYVAVFVDVGPDAIHRLHISGPTVTVP